MDLQMGVDEIPLALITDRKLQGLAHLTGVIVCNSLIP